VNFSEPHRSTSFSQFALTIFPSILVEFRFVSVSFLLLSRNAELRRRQLHLPRRETPLIPSKVRLVATERGISEKTRAVNEAFLCVPRARQVRVFKENRRRFLPRPSIRDDLRLFRDLIAGHRRLGGLERLEGGAFSLPLWLPWIKRQS